jgi:hypothetical protein
MPPVMRQQFAALLEPILSDIRNDQDYPRRETIYTRLYDKTSNPKKATITIYERAGLGDFQVKNEGGPVSFTDPISGNSITFAPIRWANGYQVTKEMMDHEQYAEIKGLETDLQIAGDEHLEVEGHRLLNGGFGTTNVNSFRAAGFDGLALFSTAHTRLDGGATQANRPSSDADLGWTALAVAKQQFQKWVDNRGRKFISRPRALWVDPLDELTARELVGSDLKPGTANNELNALKGSMEIVVTPYLTDNDSWFLKGDISNGYWWSDDGPRTQTIPYDEINEVMARKRVQGFAHGHGTWAGWYGSSGAG